ncbi:unnamed protein product [Rotaria sp. Silwood2]|nr:unnamed protein product [Rotaria sp. Silwood2]
MNILIVIFLGKAFSSVAFIQNLDIVFGTITCIQIYRVSISYFAGLVYIFGFTTRLIALILILHTPQLEIRMLIDIVENPLVDVQLSTDDELIRA